MAVIELLATRPVPMSEVVTPYKSARMIIGPEGGSKYVIPYAPRRVTHSNLGGEYVQLTRPGLPSAFIHQSADTPRMQFAILLVDKKILSLNTGKPATVKVLNTINRLKNWARKGTRVKITYGSLESGIWLILDVTVQSEERHPVTDEITQAEVALSFVRATDIVTGVGPVSGGVKPSKPITTNPPQKQTARYYYMKSGDTLWSVSVKYYGTGTKWKILADANKIKDVRKIPVGTKIRVPYI